MSKFIRSWYLRLAKAHVAWLFLLLTVLGFVAFAVLERARPAGSPGPVVLQLAFSKEAFQQVVAQWGPAGVRLYQDSTLGLDYLFPIAYAVCLSSFIALLTARSEESPSVLHATWFALPFIAALLDWLENTLHLILLANTNNLSASLILLASIAATVKWGLVAFSILVILYLVLRSMRANLAKRSIT